MSTFFFLKDRPIKTCISILFFLLGTFQLSLGQTFAFQQFTTEDGLSGSTVYRIIQDDNNYLWIATDGGVCKYDGREFLSFKNENIQGEVTGLYYDSRERIWFLDLAERISFFQNGEIFSFKRNLQDYPVKTIFEDSNQNYWFIHPTSVSVIIESDDDEYKIDHVKFDAPSFRGSMTIAEIEKDYCIIGTSRGIHHIKNYKHSYVPFTGIATPSGGFPKFNANYKNSILLSSDDRIYSFSLNDHNLQPALTHLNQYFDAGINNLFTDRNNDLWIVTRDGILYFQKQKDGSEKMIHLLKGYVTQSVFQDAENNYWIATQREGIFKLSSTDILIYNRKDLGDKVEAVNALSDDEIIIGYNNNWINILSKDLKPKFEKKISKSNSEVYDISVSDKDAVIISNSGGYQLNKKNYQIKETYIGSGFKTGTFGNDNDFWLGAFDRTSRYDKDGNRSIIIRERTYAICLGKENETWVGTVNGLYLCKKQDCQKIPNQKLEQDIRDIQIAEDGTLWIATTTNGIFLFKNNTITGHLTTQNGLSSNNCHDIFIDKNIAWIATKNGINKVDINNLSVQVIRKDNGLPSNDIKGIHIQGNAVYTATDKGLATFDKSLKTSSSVPSLSFSSIQIGNRDTTHQSSFDLPYDKNDIKISFNGVTFKNSKDILYQYKMLGLNDEWIPTNINIASYPSLPHGEYEFQVRAKTTNSSWTPTQKINFRIRKAFWQTWWFYGLIALVSFLLGAKFLQVVIGEIKQRNEIQQNLKESQLTALRAQMDPHFIFNSLNSIQDFIIQEDKRSANHYLSKFSKLMRNILDASDKKKISLKKELDYLKLYLSLEALRFENNFEYFFEMDEKINEENTFIPSMLIQPYVENAIKHGLMHRKENKKLYIRFFQKENYLLCEVEDNGIGRDASREINERNSRVYKSKAMSLTKERIDLLNSAEPDQLGLEIIDLKNKEGQAKGTKVMIRIFQKS